MVDFENCLLTSQSFSTLKEYELENGLRRGKPFFSLHLMRKLNNNFDVKEPCKLQQKVQIISNSSSSENENDSQNQKKKILNSKNQAIQLKTISIGTKQILEKTSTKRPLSRSPSRESHNSSSSDSTSSIKTKARIDKKINERLARQVQTSSIASPFLGKTNSPRLKKSKLVDVKIEPCDNSKRPLLPIPPIPPITRSEFKPNSSNSIEASRPSESVKSTSFEFKASNILFKKKI